MEIIWSAFSASALEGQLEEINGSAQLGPCTNLKGIHSIVNMSCDTVIVPVLPGHERQQCLTRASKR
jgi:hypothetical protein